MKNDNTPTEGISSDQREGEASLDGASCSPSVSNTPETDAFEATQHPSCRFPVVLCKMRKLERERNAAIAALSSIEERYIDGCDTYEDWKFMGGIARSFFEENADVEARDQ